VKSWDAIIIGGGIIGVSLALELRRNGSQVLIVDRSEPGREASHAGAGMLAARDPETPVALRELALASARLYPEFVAELEVESGLRIDFRRKGTIYFGDASKETQKCLSESELRVLEPALEYSEASAILLEEDSVDPRDIMAAALAIAKRLGIEIAKGLPVVELQLAGDRVTGVRTTRTNFTAPIVVNCCGAWAGEIGPLRIPTRPVKGQLLSVVFPHYGPEKLLIQHVIRTDAVYLVPRSDGRILIGATVEEAGFDKRVDLETIKRLHQLAALLVPQIGEARIHENWAGLRPGSPDGLPIMGTTSIEGYFAATGHYRNGILLAPATALAMSRVIRGVDPEFDLSAFSPSRFASENQYLEPQRTRRGTKVHKGERN
jgi:glycine oxidase